jgi:hypothetical protein
MKKFLKLLLILTLLPVLPPTLYGAPVGKMTHIEGRVDITSGGETRPVSLGDPVSIGDTLRAKSKARGEVTFLDGNILRLAENTRIRITDYREGDGKASKLELSRGKVQNIVSKLAPNALYEVHTPTAVCGVRGTNFFAFFLDGTSGFIPKEGVIYGYSLGMPDAVKSVMAGQSLLIHAANQPAVLQPATSEEVERHMRDTIPVGRERRGGQQGQEGGVVENIINEVGLLSVFPVSLASAIDDFVSVETALSKIQDVIGNLNITGSGILSTGGVAITDAMLNGMSLLSLVDMEYDTASYPIQGFSNREYALPGGGLAGEYLNFTQGAPVGGISTITSAGAQAMWGDKSLSAPQSFTVIAGGIVNGLFDPSSTPLTWADIPEGGMSAIETGTFLTQQAFMSDSDRKNLEQTARIPAFDVGIATLSGSNGTFSVSMNNIKFFRFQSEADPRIWATNSVNGSYTSIPVVGSQVTLTSANGLSGLSHTFEIKQWDTANRLWGASLYRGAGDAGGTLLRSEADKVRTVTGNLPVGASSTISITELRGGAAGTIIPQPYPLPSNAGVFVGTAAGSVR